MKITKEVEAILKRAGFYPEDKTDFTGWWTLKDGWSFMASEVRGLPYLANRLKATAKEDAKINPKKGFDGWRRNTKKAYEVLSNIPKPVHQRIKLYVQRSKTFDEIDVQEREKEIQSLLKPGYGITLGGYAYYPNKSFTTWTASDGGVIKSTTALLILDYGGTDRFTDFLYSDNFDEFIIKKHVSQEEYESGVMRGDHY